MPVYRERDFASEKQIEKMDHNQVECVWAKKENII